MRPPRVKRNRTKLLAGPTLVPRTARAGSRLRPVPRGKFGVVRVTRGRYAGHLAYYDDDAEQGTSIIYPWGSVPAGYVAVRHASLALATPTEARLWKEVNENPFARRTMKKWFEQHRATRD